MVGGSRCFKCGKTSHFSKDYAATVTSQVSRLIFFHLDQRGNKKADSSSLIVGGAVVAPASVTLRITNGRQGKAEALVLRSQDFQLTVEEAHTMSYVVMGMYFLCISLFALMFMLIII